MFETKNYVLKKKFEKVCRKNFEKIIFEKLCSRKKLCLKKKFRSSITSMVEVKVNGSKISSTFSTSILKSVCIIHCKLKNDIWMLL